MGHTNTTTPTLLMLPSSFFRALPACLPSLCAHPLAAWLRLKYPHIVDGAIAASAPVFAMAGLRRPTPNPESFAETVTRAAGPAGGAAEWCSDNVRRAFSALLSPAKGAAQSVKPNEVSPAGGAVRDVKSVKMSHTEGAEEGFEAVKSAVGKWLKSSLPYFFANYVSF